MIGLLTREVRICRHTLLGHQSSLVAPQIKFSVLHRNKTWASHPRIHILYHGMHAFHLQCCMAGVVLIFKLFPHFVCGVFFVGKHVWSVTISHVWLWPIWLVQPTLCAANKCRELTSFVSFDSNSSKDIWACVFTFNYEDTCHFCIKIYKASIMWSYVYYICIWKKLVFLIKFTKAVIQILFLFQFEWGEQKMYYYYSGFGISTWITWRNVVGLIWDFIAIVNSLSPFEHSFTSTAENWKAAGVNCSVLTF